MSTPDSLKYAEDAARCAEILRIALPMMSRQKAGVHPVSYAVWFDHMAGRNPRLSAVLNRLMQDGQVLDDHSTAQLYHEHVADGNEQTASKLAESIRRVMKEIADSAQVAGTQTACFGDSLDRFSQVIEQHATVDADALQDVQVQTQQVRRAVSALRDQLEASQKEIEQLRSEINRARTEALVDSLTGLANRRAFDQALESTSALIGSRPCLLVADIDHFKSINDTYGHLFGDKVLKLVAQALKTAAPSPMTVARVGGEEFAVLTTGLSLEAALALAERIRHSVAASRIQRKESKEPIGQITLSLGVAPWQANDTAESWYARADRALYTSKSQGRNRVTAG